MPSQLWVLFLMPLIGISPNSCSGGACANAHLQSSLYPRSSHSKLDTCSVAVSFNLLRMQRCCSANPTSYSHKQSHIYTLCQHSCRDPEWSSKAPFTHASNCSPKAVARMVSTDQLLWLVRTNQSGIGTYQESPMWAACSLTRNYFAVTSRSGTCQTWRTCPACFIGQNLLTATSLSGTCRASLTCLTCLMKRHNCVASERIVCVCVCVRARARERKVLGFYE